MARIAASTAQDREKLAYEAFSSNPKMSVKEVQQTLEERDGFKMNLGRIYQIATAARANPPAPIPPRKVKQKEAA